MTLLEAIDELLRALSRVLNELAYDDTTDTECANLREAVMHCTRASAQIKTFLTTANLARRLELSLKQAKKQKRSGRKRRAR